MILVGPLSTSKLHPLGKYVSTEANSDPAKAVNIPPQTETVDHSNSYGLKCDRNDEDERMVTLTQSPVLTETQRWCMKAQRVNQPSARSFVKRLERPLAARVLLQ